ncbi:MAG: helix-turn-helix transcriptional regulator [Enterocloster sp.]
MSFELDRIEELCNDRGWSHYRLAKEMDISPNSIGNLFRRTTVPSIPTLRHICQVFGISMGEFYSTDGSQTILNKQQKYVLDLYNQLGRLIRSGQNLIWKDWLMDLIGRKGIKKRKKKTAGDFVGLSFSCVLLFVYSPLANTR